MDEQEWTHLKQADSAAGLATTIGKAAVNPTVLDHFAAEAAVLYGDASGNMVPAGVSSNGSIAASGLGALGGALGIAGGAMTVADGLEHINSEDHHMQTQGGLEIAGGSMGAAAGTLNMMMAAGVLDTTAVAGLAGSEAAIAAGTVAGASGAAIGATVLGGAAAGIGAATAMENLATQSGLYTDDQGRAISGAEKTADWGVSVKNYVDGFFDDGQDVGGGVRMTEDGNYRPVQSSFLGDLAGGLTTLVAAPTAGLAMDVAGSAWTVGDKIDHFING